MKVKVLLEAGFEPAMLGLSLSYNAVLENMPDRATKLAHTGFGNSKFLESILVWLDVTAPRYWWQQMDTYRIGTKQSESTMHTLLRKQLTQEDFAFDIPPDWLNFLNTIVDLELKKRLLPESFLQRRILCFSYKTLQNIYYQRQNHKLSEWREFCCEMLKQLEHSEYLREI